MSRTPLLCIVCQITCNKMYFHEKLPFDEHKSLTKLVMNFQKKKKVSYEFSKKKKKKTKRDCFMTTVFVVVTNIMTRKWPQILQTEVTLVE